MFEKVLIINKLFQKYAKLIYVEFKLKNYFNEAEIVNKSRSIKSVIEPFSTQSNLYLLKLAVFENIMTVQKYVCFE